MRDHDPFTEVLVALRAQIRDGRRPPRSPLVATDISRSLRVSATPVREALHRLAGEGLVEIQRGRGFAVRRLEALDVADLYRLHRLYLAEGRSSAALRFGPWPTPSDQRASDPQAVPKRVRADTEALFHQIVSTTGNAMLIQALDTLADHLAAVRLIEGSMFADLGRELDELANALRINASGALAAAVEAYHTRRISAARSLAAAVRENFRS